MLIRCAFIQLKENNSNLSFANDSVNKILQSNRHNKFITMVLPVHSYTYLIICLQIQSRVIAMNGKFCL